MTDHPAGPDPKYPDRPDHPDFRRMSEVIMEMDSNQQFTPRRRAAYVALDRPEPARFNPFQGIVDPASVSYMAEARVAMGLKHFREGLLRTDKLDELMQALWMEAFACGVKFQQAGGHHGR